MAFDSSAVSRLAHLARIGVDEKTAGSLGSELEHILAMVDQLREADVAGVAPMAHPLELTQRMRPDEVTESPERDSYQENAPRVQDGVYVVPKVLGG